MLPSGPISLVKKISAHFSMSSLRRAKIQEDMSEESYAQFYSVLSYIEARWISFLKAAERILKIWDNLRAYFVDDD